jgi:hypothetical protein
VASTPTKETMMAMRRFTKQAAAQAMARTEPSVVWGQQAGGYWERQYMRLTVAELAGQVVERATGSWLATRPAWDREFVEAVAELALAAGLV